jgi:hypothetical protein
MKISRYALGIMGAAFTISIAMVAALEVSVAALPASPSTVSASINRMNKADRMPVASLDRGHPAPVLTPGLPEGCVAALRWERKTIYTAEIAGRCLV